ncbi:MAG: hypothetical protein Q9184_007731 [Pyrenodesmia sp. 2 TL-2023]
MKPIIQDFLDVIQLSWKIHKAQMQQADVRKQINKNNQEGHLAVFDLYQDLYGHEHKAIENEIARAGSGASLVSLKRTTSNLWHRDISFKGVPGLQFVVERLAQWPGFPQAPEPFIYESTAKNIKQEETQVRVELSAASESGDEKRKRNAGASSRFRQRRKEKERNLEWQRFGALAKPFSVGEAQSTIRGQYNNVPNEVEAESASAVDQREISTPEPIHIYSGPSLEQRVDHNQGYSSSRRQQASTSTPGEEARFMVRNSDVPQASEKDRYGDGGEQKQQVARPLRHKPKMTRAEASPHSRIESGGPPEQMNSDSERERPLSMTGFEEHLFAPKSILRAPRNTFSKDPAPVREGVAPLKDASKEGIPARWTKVDRKFIDREVLDAAHERYESKGEYLLVLRVLTKEEIEHYAARTQALRNARDFVPGVGRSNSVFGGRPAQILINNSQRDEFSLPHLAYTRRKSRAWSLSYDDDDSWDERAHSPRRHRSGSVLSQARDRSRDRSRRKSEDQSRYRSRSHSRRRHSHSHYREHASRSPSPAHWDYETERKIKKLEELVCKEKERAKQEMLIEDAKKAAKKEKEEEFKKRVIAEGYLSASPPRSSGALSADNEARSPGVFEYPGINIDGGTTGDDDPFVGSERHARHLSGYPHEMPSPLYDGATGSGIGTEEIDEPEEPIKSSPQREAQEPYGFYGAYSVYNPGTPYSQAGRSFSRNFSITHLPKKDEAIEVAVEVPASTAEEPKEWLPSKENRKRRTGAGDPQKECASCHTRATPEWRRGPSGNRDLCNSCGLRWAEEVRSRNSRSSNRQAEVEIVTTDSLGNDENIAKVPEKQPEKSRPTKSKKGKKGKKARKAKAVEVETEQNVIGKDTEFQGITPEEGSGAGRAGTEGADNPEEPIIYYPDEEDRPYPRGAARRASHHHHNHENRNIFEGTQLAASIPAGVDEDHILAKEETGRRRESARTVMKPLSLSKCDGDDMEEDEQDDLEFAATLAAGMDASGFPEGGVWVAEKSHRREDVEMPTTLLAMSDPDSADTDEEEEEEEEAVEDDMMDEAEAERVVRDLLEKYTTLFTTPTQERDADILNT